jgi:uncharacterized protein YecE (DUF72 family)
VPGPEDTNHLAAVAAMLKMKPGLHIGTSGWSYGEDWVGAFYSSKSSMLEQYLAYFNTVEINSTFYALPKPKFISHLAELVSPSKFFTAKIPKKVTHDHRLDLSGEGGEVLSQFFELMTPLRSKLPVMLIQLPPWNIDDMANLESFLSALDTRFRYAIEFRHESWLKPAVYSLLEKYGVATVVVDEPKLPVDLRTTADFAYVRWHGHGTSPWYRYRYSVAELEGWVPRIQSLESQSKTVLGYFNNHFYGNAPLNALQLLQMLNATDERQETKLAHMLEKAAAAQSSLDDF